MKEQNHITNIVDSKFYPLWLFFVSFVFVTLFSRSTSFLYVFEGADPSVFKQMGRAILKGKIMYVDYFDNKGCLLYFIHALGLWLGGNTALLVMQAISLTVTLLIWDKMLALFRSPRQRLTSLIVALFLLFCFYGAGDQTQEWCLPFISYPLLVFLRTHHSKTEIRPLQMLAIGVCSGIITFIQINNACAFLGFIAYLWFQFLAKKEFKKLFQSIGCFMTGWLTIAVPCVLYFYIQAGWHGIYEMAYASFLSNFEYIAIQHQRQWYYWLPYSVFIASIIGIQIVNYRNEKRLMTPILISISLFVLTFGRLCNSFYLASLLPLFIINMATIDFSKSKAKNRILPSVALLFAFFIGIMSFFHFFNDLLLQNEKEVVIYKDFHKCIENIPTEERDSIHNYNLFWHGYSMMQHEDLLQCNRVSIAYDLPTLMKQESSKQLAPPKWIMMSPNMRYYDEDAKFILNNYELVDSLHYDRLYFHHPRIGNELEILFFRRKD